MRRFMLLNCLIILLFILNQSLLIHCECNACNADTNTTCISETEFQQCEDNKPFGIIYKCNKGYYCSIHGTCMASEEHKDCQMCQQCDPNDIFACTGTQSFALCVNGTPTDMTGQCTGDYNCNINDPNICGINIATCSYRDDPTEAPTISTPSPEQDPNGFCQLIQKEGRFPVGTNPQTTCRQYVSCVKIANTWYGPIYNCPGQTYFDMSQNGCVVNKPSICRGTVTRLAFRNILWE